MIRAIMCVWSRKWVSQWKNSVQCPCFPTALVLLLHLSHSPSAQSKYDISENAFANYSSSDTARIQVECCCMSLLFCCISLASHTTPPPRLCSLWNQSAFPVYSSWHQLTHSKGVIKNVISTVYIPLNFLDGPNTYEHTVDPKNYLDT